MGVEVIGASFAFVILLRLPHYVATSPLRYDEAMPDQDSPGLDDLLVAATRTLRRSWRTGLETIDTVDLAPHDARALMMVARHAPVRPGTIADHLHIAARSATDVIDRLEERGLVTRSPDPGDRRATVIDLTEEGRRLVSVVRSQRSAAAEEHFSVLTDDERRTLATLLRKLAGSPSRG